VICNTSPLQYLYQLGSLDLLPALAGRITIPKAVLKELEAGRALGLNLPDPTRLDWITIRCPASAVALPLVTDLGPGETEVVALALELIDAVVILDDALARQVAETLGIRVIGTLGVLLDAKRAGLVPAIAPLLDQLEALRFRLAPHTRAAVLKLAAEVTSATSN
jgi:Predicted nucleic acid-binding protein, contains PIN domain